MPPNQPPASLRYFKARLRSLAQPPVWGTAIFISVVGLAAWEYGLNPGLQPSSQKKEVASKSPAYPSLSQEDSRIGADIDSLPVLFHDFDRTIAPAAPIASNKKTQTTQTKGAVKDLLTQKATFSADTQSTSIAGAGAPSSAAPNLENPFLVQAQKLLQAGSLDSRGTSLGVNIYTASSSQPVAEQKSGSSLGVQLPTVTNQNQIVAPISHQSAIANPTAMTYPQAPTNVLGQSLLTGLPAGTGSIPPTVTNTTPPPNSYTYLVGSGPVPGVAPAAPVAPPVTPIAPYSVQVPDQATGSYTNPELTSNFGSGLPPSQLQQPNFTTPRSISGREIGGRLN